MSHVDKIFKSIGRVFPLVEMLKSLYLRNMMMPFKLPISTKVKKRGRFSSLPFAIKGCCVGDDDLTPGYLKYPILSFSPMGTKNGNDEWMRYSMARLSRQKYDDGTRRWQRRRHLRKKAISRETWHVLCVRNYTLQKTSSKISC